MFTNYKGKNNFTVEKSGRHHLNQEIKFNITSSEINWNHVPRDRMQWITCQKCVTYKRKHQTSPDQAYSAKWLVCNHQKCQGEKIKRQRGTVPEWERKVTKTSWQLNATHNCGLDPFATKDSIRIIKNGKESEDEMLGTYWC